MAESHSSSSVEYTDTVDRLYF